MDYLMMGSKIRNFRRKKGLTQEELAEAAGLSASFMGHIERGTRIASLDTVVKLCAALGITPNDLLSDAVTLGEVDLPEKIVVDPKKLMRGITLLLQNQEEFL